MFSKEKFRYNTIQDVINDTGLTIRLVVETDGYNTLGDGFDAKYLITNINEQGSILLKNGNYAKEISNSNGSKKLDKGNVSSEYDTAEKIEYQIKKLQADTIEDLKTMNFLKVGDIVEVLGYYTAGDGAGHKRIIKSEDDGSGVLLNNGLYANEIKHQGLTTAAKDLVGAINELKTEIENLKENKLDKNNGNATGTLTVDDIFIRG